MEYFSFGSRSGFKGGALMELKQNLKIKEYMDTVCKQIKFKEVHEDIKLELEDHILELTDEYISQNVPEDEAINKALSHMGDAVTVGKQLNNSHKAKPEWSLLILTMLFTGFGLLTMYFIETKSALLGSSLSLFTKTLVSNLIGICLATLLYFFDYRKIQKYSVHIYITTLLFLAFTIFTGHPVNGVGAWIRIEPFSMNFASICPYFFAVALAGILDNWHWKDIKKLLLGLILILTPIIFIMLAYSLSDAAAYFMVIITLTYVFGKNSFPKLLLPSLLLCSGIGVSIIFLIKEPYRMQRFLVFINPSRDPLGSGYVNMQLNKILHSASLLGQGFTLNSKIIPDIHTDFIFSYIIYTFGWAVGVTFIFLVIIYIVRLIKACRVIKNNYGKGLISGLTAIIATQFLWNILMILGLAPISGVSLPFISYGGSRLIMNMASLGLVLSIYRRKDISSASYFKPKKAGF